MKQEEIAKFQVGDILPLALTIVVAGIGLAYGISILGDTKDDMGTTDCAARSDGFTNYNSTSDLCYNSSGSTATPTSAYFNASGDSITAVAKFPSKLGLIVTVVVAAVLIGILVRYLLVR